MSNQRVYPKPSNFWNLLYVKSLPVLNRMLGPDIAGTKAKNFRILDVKIVNAQTVVVIEQTTDVSIDIATATAAQKVVREIPYNRYSISSVFHHYLGNVVFGGDVPGNEYELKLWLAERTDKIEIDDTLYVEYGSDYVSIRPKDPKDLKWHGVVFLKFSASTSSDDTNAPETINADDNVTISKLSLSADLSTEIDNAIDKGERVYVGINSDVTTDKRIVVGVKVEDAIQLKQTYTIKPGQRLIASVPVNIEDDVDMISFVVLSTDAADETIYAEELTAYNAVLPTAMRITDAAGAAVTPTFEVTSLDDELDLGIVFDGVDSEAYHAHKITWSVTGFAGITLDFDPANDQTARLTFAEAPTYTQTVTITARMGTKLIATHQLTLNVPAAGINDGLALRIASDVDGQNVVTSVSADDPLYVFITSTISVPKTIRAGTVVAGVMTLNDYVIEPIKRRVIVINPSTLGDMTEFQVAVLSTLDDTYLADQTIQYSPIMFGDET